MIFSKKKGKIVERKKSKKEADKWEIQLADHHETNHGEETTSAATISNTKLTRTRGKRGVAAMYEVMEKKALGKKIKVKYNDAGLPKGKERQKLQSYVGILARTKVPIDIEKWPQVDPDLKERIWIDVQDTFRVDERIKKVILTSAGSKWRGFKTMLTKNYVLPYLGNKKALRKPPKQYNFVGLESWKQFVKQRSTEKWMTLHRAQSARVKKRKYHHRISRKGFIGLDEELREMMNLPKGEAIDRAIMWVKARERKDGTVDEDVAVMVEKIDELMDKKNKGKLEIFGSDDVLTLALGTPEHSGRVRGVGGFITPSTFFGRSNRLTKADLLARDKQQAQKLEDMKNQQAKENEALHCRIAHLEALIQGKEPVFRTPHVSAPKAEGDMISPISDNGSSHVPEHGLSSKLFEDDTMKEPLGCCQIIPPPTERVNLCIKFSLGTLLEGDGLKEGIHGSQLPVGSVRVFVDGSAQPDEPLPLPVKEELESESVREVVGSNVAWPEELVIPKVINQKKKRKLDNNKTIFAKDIGTHPKVPKRCWLLYKYAKTILQETGLSITKVLDDVVFGREKVLHVLHDDIINVLEMNRIGQTVIATYMAHLYEILKEKDELNIFAFVNPQDTYRCERKEFIPYIVNRLKEGKSDRTFLIPYNPGEHWILTTICEDEIYVLDSMPKPTCYKTWEDSIITAIKMFNAEMGKFNNAPELKHLPGVPKQPGGIECGYYVMRYMKDIISDKSLSWSNKWTAKTRKSYTEAEIDEVRIEVADYLQALM